jgi:hypothetical protein
MIGVRRQTQIYLAGRRSVSEIGPDSLAPAPGLATDGLINAPAGL